MFEDDAAILDPDLIDRSAPALRDLAAAAAEPNPFFEPFMLRPALANYSPRQAVLFSARRDGVLIGAFPLQRTRTYRGAPLQHLETLRHPHLYLGVPLVRSGAERVFAAAFFDWLDARGTGVAFVSLRLLRREGAVFQSLAAEAKAQGRAFIETKAFSRPFATRAGISEGARAFSAQTLKRLRTKRRKLGADGPVVYETLPPGGPWREWFDGFLALEHAGWKGAAGTSILSDRRDEAFFRACIEAAAYANRLRFARLTAGGRPVAYSVDIAAGGGGFALKIAHDPAVEKHSPGVLLEQSNLDDFANAPALDWIDSCAAPDHSVLSRMWPETTSVANVMIERKSLLSRSCVRGWRLARSLRDRAKGKADDAPRSK